ncbi:MAG: serine/threonine-protein kinase [Burkholderiaceae bacterium]
MGLEKLGRYDIIRTLGKGAMGMVYEARDPNLDRRVAIKTIKVEHLSLEASAEYEARFRTEARSAARLQHPNIVSVYDSERHGDTTYLVMEFVPGDDLKKILDSGKTFTLEQAMHLMRDLLSALEYAHRQNIVHRDVKPANMLVEASGRVKLTDFGVARIQDSGEATRTRGSMVGTLKYMAPEQVQGLTVDARADIFAAGVVLYQLLTGKRPFDGASDFAIIQQIVGAAPVAPSIINTQLPAAVDVVVGRALAKSRDERFASANAFMVALQEAVGQVSDPTILPPMGLRHAGDGAGTGSGVQRGYGRSGGGTYPSVSGVSASTVTQELELVYWKDIKDSDDPADLQGFLDRFPGGIYADLARRRFKRLLGLSTGDNTGTALQTRVLEGTGSFAHSGFPPTQPMSEETLLVGAPGSVGKAVMHLERGAGAAARAWPEAAAPAEPSAQAVGLPGTDAAPGEIAAAVHTPADDAGPGTLVTETPVATAATPRAAASGSEKPAVGTTNAPPVVAVAPAASKLAVAEKPVSVARGNTGQGPLAKSSSPGQTQALPAQSAPDGAGAPAPRRAGLMLAGGAAMVVAIALAVWSFGPSSGGEAPLPAGTPASTNPPVPGNVDSSVATVVANPAADAASAAPVAPTPLAEAPLAVTKELPRSAGNAAASTPPKAKPALPKLAQAPPAAAPASKDSAPEHAAAAAALPAPAPVKPAVAKAPNPVQQTSTAGVASPELACEGRVLLGFQSCMNEQCAKAEFAAQPICKQRRMAAQARAAQQNNRN